MIANDNAGYLKPRGVLASIASRLAPTGVRFTAGFGSAAGQWLLDEFHPGQTMDH